MRKAAAVALFGFALAGCRREPPLPIYGAVPPFSLTAQNGRPFARTALDGQVWVADFIFTTCRGPCPLMSYKMRRLQDVAARYPDVRLVSFTVDPAHDTPAVLAEYAGRYRADPARWFFLTGQPAALDALGRGAFKLQSVDGSLIHSTRFVLVDRRSQIRGYYDSAEDGFLERIAADIAHLREEGS